MSIVKNMPELNYPLEYPKGETEASLLEYLSGFYIEGEGHSDELIAYLREDFRRFIYTYNLLPSNYGNMYEIGSNPYFISLLIKKFSQYNLTCSNYFGSEFPEYSSQTLINEKINEKIIFEFSNSNIEISAIQTQEKYDVILFCEVIEHLVNDPVNALLNIKDALKPEGHLILTTPNVNRLENVAKMLSGSNIYDPYSGYGPYGRHNREYNKHELFLLLKHLGFDIEIMFSSDVHVNRAGDFYDVNKFKDLVEYRKHDLGQYIFVRAKNTKKPSRKKPSWLFRSYPTEMLQVG